MAEDRKDVKITLYWYVKKPAIIPPNDDPC